ncbi:MAG: DUF4384 domain-containing protein [Treponema sp.]|nr:DUF4384 domain-containing protein [Treponema sp.]
MKNKIAIAALIAALFAAASVHAKDLEFDEMLKVCADEICQGIDGKVKTIAVVDVETEFWALSDHIVDELNHWFVKKLDSVNVVTRDEFAAALTRNEIEYNRTGEVTDETMQEFARLGYDCVVKGNFSDVAGGYQLIITALNTESLKQYSSWKGKIKAKDPDVKYLIDKSKKSPRPVVRLNKKTVVQDSSSNLLGKTSSGATLNAVMIDADGNPVTVVHPGDAIRFRVESSKNAYLAILCVDAKGQEEWLPISNDFIRAGESRIFPDLQGAVLRVDEGMYGNEKVVVYAANSASELPNQKKMMSVQSNTRGLSLSGGSATAESATINYKIEKKR